MISPISSDLSFSRSQLYHHLRTRSYVIPLDLSMRWSWVNTEFRYTEYFRQPMINCLPLPANLSRYFSAHLIVLNSLHSYNYELTNELSPSSLSQFSPNLPPPHRLPPNRPPPNQLLPDTPPMSNKHGLQVHLQTRSISASKGISKRARSRPPSVFPISFDHGLHVHINVRRITVWSNDRAIMASEGNASEKAGHAWGGV